MSRFASTLQTERGLIIDAKDRPFSVRISQEQLQALARAIVDELVRADAMDLASSHERAQTAVFAELEAYFKAVAELDRDSEKLADQHLRAAGRDGVGLDRRRIVQGIKEKLAEERGFPV